MKNTTATTLEDVVFQMFQEGTGAALCDSGGAYGRHWERNQRRTLEDFRNDPEVSWSEHSYYTISTFHYLIKAAGLELDETCRRFNALDCEDWDGAAYGISKAQSEWLESEGFEFYGSWNTYNGETSLSQVLQGTRIKRETDDGERYVLLQLHQGCDVRGGYTDARLFKLQGEFMGSEDVYGCVTKPDGTVIPVSNTWTRYDLRDENGNDPEITDADTVELELAEFSW